MAMLVKYGTSLAKLGLLGGAVGVTSHYGVWGDTEQGVQAYKQLQELVEPYTPEEISKLKPMSSLGLDSRSDSVQKTFEFVSDAPSLVSGGMDSLTDTVKKQFKE
ncbi:uncharacterized protein LOC132554851 [Ylistrum balloti]|uniref:uncharacterized protein LOC132554851 n=1 Tax=Ylistrum balloti TaxID=509963 RepID=UPI002905BAE6|nr:uncharacterized protein LOC132554851 [Ylistrum balloti]